MTTLPSKDVGFVTLDSNSQPTPAELVRQIVDRWRLEHADIPVDMAQFGGLLVYTVECATEKAVETEQWEILRSLDPAHWFPDRIITSEYNAAFAAGLRAAWERVAERIENGKRAA